MGSITKPCLKCGMPITIKNMARHIRNCSGVPQVTSEPQNPCPRCKKLITLSHMTRHLKKCTAVSLKRKHNQPIISNASKIPRMDPSPSTSSNTGSIRSSIISAFDTVKSAFSKLVKGKGDEIREVETAFKGRMKTYAIDNTYNIKDPVTFLEKAMPLIARKIQEHAEKNNIKVNFEFLTEHEYFAQTIDKPTVKKMNFKTKNSIILPTTNIIDYVKNAKENILSEMEEFQAKGSGWTLHKILQLELRINRYVPLRGSTYIKLPVKIASKKAVLNIQNNDQKCFMWSILAALHPVHKRIHPHRIHHYQPYEHELDSYLEGISFPVTLDNIRLFEKRSDISINVYAFDEKYIVYPLIVTMDEREKHVDLLYLKDKNTTHYCLIRDLSRLVRSQLTKHHNKTLLCKRCLTYLATEDLLNKHKEFCNKHEAVKIEMPDEGTSLKFKDYQHSMRVPFVMYADFECMLTPILPEDQHSETNNKKESYTKKYQKHEAVSFSYYIVYSDYVYKRPVYYFGTDAAQKFVERLLEESKEIYKLYSREATIPMHLTEEDLEVINNAQNCHICGERFEKGNPKVRDHDHLTGRFRGVAHNSCNLNYKKPTFIPIFIHNLSGYDTHIFIKMFGLNNETIDVIPNNEERYISYTINVENGVKLRFLDSCRFMAFSLDSLAKNLTPEQFKHSSKYYSGDQLQLLIKKGVYPYDYMDSLEKFQLTSLPAQEDFYNKLNMTDISDQDYEHAKKVWVSFGIKNMKEYTLLYNLTDVLLLADIMENFREVCLHTYKLDPAWYYTAPGLAWNAMLKTTGIELELFSDYEMVLMVGEGIRGGLSQCSHRHAKANNPYMEDYNINHPTKYLIYLDMNNLYGWGMSQYMPYADFSWLDRQEIELLDVATIADDSEIGYILEVDLVYPKELHDLHCDYPLAPEQRVPPGSTQKKLMATLFDKNKYVVHYRNLKQYLSLGIKLERIHRVIRFSQKAWLKTYIDLNTQMRTKATNDSDKDFFKLMNNSVFGKTMENIRNRVNIKLATKDKQVDIWMSKPNFKSRTIFTEQLAAIHMTKTRLMFNKPIYVGMSILDVSKTIMYDFHYNTIKKRYGENAQLQYTDTDSLTYSIETRDFYEDVKEMIDLFDTSDYPDPNRYSMPRVNKKVLGKMKDELNGRIMYEHVGLRSKMYSSRSEPKDKQDDGEIKKLKGVKRVVIKDHLEFKDYKRCLEDGLNQYSTMNMIRSYRHDLFSVEIKKISLSAMDDKRYVLEDGIGTLPWGHYAIPEEVMRELTTNSKD